MVGQSERSLKGRPETGKLASDTFFRVTGDGHQGISLSGVSHSAIGSRLQAPAADGRHPEFNSPANHLVSGFPLSPVFSDQPSL
jgi:hypothetical protein